MRYVMVGRAGPLSTYAAARGAGGQGAPGEAGAAGGVRGEGVRASAEVAVVV